MTAFTLSLFLCSCGGQDTIPASTEVGSETAARPAIGQDTATNTPGTPANQGDPRTDVPVATDAEREAATVLAKHLDMDRPGMEPFRAALARRDHRGLLALFRERLVKRLRATDYSREKPRVETLRTYTSDAEMMLGRMTPEQYKAAYKREWRDEFSKISPEDFPLLQEAGLMAPLGTPVRWLGAQGNTDRVGYYMGAWGGGGWCYNTALVDAWWWSGKTEYKDRWLEVTGGYLHEFFTKSTREKLNALGVKPNAFFHLHTAWRVQALLSSLALICKYPDHAQEPPKHDWMNHYPSEALQKEFMAAGAPMTAELTVEQLEAIPAVPLAWIAIGMVDELAPFLVEAYVTGDYFFANQNYDGIVSVATVAYLFQELKAAGDLGATADRALPWWADRVIFRDGGPLEQCWGYSGGYSKSFAGLVGRFEALGHKAAWMDEIGKLSSLTAAFWDGLQAPRGILPCVGNLKYGSLAPTGKADPQVSTYFPFSGYAALRTPGTAKDQLYLMFANSRRSVGHKSPNTGSIHVSAYGRDLIVPGGSPSYSLTPPEGKAEEAAFDNYAAEHSTLKNSTMVVNGLSQASTDRGRFNELLDSASKVPVHARWLSDPEFDYVESRWCGYERRMSNSMSAPVEERIPDIEHRRRVVFVKRAGLWLITDLMTYSDALEPQGKARGGMYSLEDRQPAKASPSPYRFTQIWNMAPPPDEKRHHAGFTEGQVVVDKDARRIRTTDPSGANVELLHFIGRDLRYEKYFGLKNPKQYLGWMVDGKGAPATPRVDVHAVWEQSREELVAGKAVPLVTVIAPSRTATSIIKEVKARVEQEGRIAGCELIGVDGSAITMLASATPSRLTSGKFAAHAELLVLMRAPGETVQRGIVLGCQGLSVGGNYDAWHPVETPDFEFSFDGKKIQFVAAITVPTGDPAVLKASGSK
jgi:hypothetical protein